MKSPLYHKTVLDNGIRIITERTGHVRSVSLGVWINVGSRDEKPCEYGVSHFIEHMHFKGTKRRSAKDIAVALESLGGSLNAFTGREQTCYYVRILDEHLSAAVDVLSDILKNSLMLETEFKKERKVILEELKDIEDTPSDLVHDVLMQTIWPKQSLGQPIIGTKRSVSGLTREQLIKYLKTNYSNPNVVIAACGNLEHKAFVDMVKKHFKFSSSLKSDSLKGTSPLAVRSNFTAAHKDSAQTHICLGVPSHPYNTERRYAALILNDVLGGGMSSRLFQSIREDLGLAYSIYSFIDFFEDTGVFGVFLSTDKRKTIEAVDSVLEQIRKFKSKRLSEQELQQAKYQLKGNLILNLESTSSQMTRLARNELYLNKHIDLDETLKNIDRVKATQISDMANELLDKENFCLAILGPVEKGVLKKIDWDKVR
jgi:predicted Zn-dependent peptidase